MEEDIDKAEKYKEYCQKESDEAYATISKSQEEYDKQLLTLSTGLLAVILAFLEDIVHLNTAVWRSLLYFGLTGLGLTILSVIISLQVGIFVLTKVREYWKEHYEGNTEHKFPERLSDITTYINWAGGVCFVLGIAFTLAFIVVNLAH